jgi:hypothetical protein
MGGQLRSTCTAHLKPGTENLGSRVESRGAFKLWVKCVQAVGQRVQPPPLQGFRDGAAHLLLRGRHAVAAQVAFERHTFKPGLICKGKGLTPVAFKLWVNSVQLVQPRHAHIHNGDTPECQRGRHLRWRPGVAVQVAI